MAAFEGSPTCAAVHVVPDKVSVNPSEPVAEVASAPTATQAVAAVQETEDNLVFSLSLPDG